jgi:hypothetical protein
MVSSSRIERGEHAYSNNALFFGGPDLPLSMYPALEPSQTSVFRTASPQPAIPPADDEHNPWLLWTELSRYSSTSGEDSVDDHLGQNALDWSTWIYPDPAQWIGQGSYGDVFVGIWRGLPSYLREPPRVVVKRMKYDRLSDSEAEKRRYKVSQCSSRDRLWTLNIRLRNSDARLPSGKGSNTRILCPFMVSARTLLGSFLP